MSQKAVDPWYSYEITDLSRWPQPKDITRTDFHSGMLGMCEMESAAERIVRLSQALGRWRRVTINDMENESERNGFVELVYSHLLDKSGGSGWIAYCYNGSFTPSKRLIEIMAKPERRSQLRQEDVA